MNPHRVALLGADPNSVAALADALQQSPQLAQLPLDIQFDCSPRQAQSLRLLLALGAEASPSQRASQAQLRQVLTQAAGGYQVIHGNCQEALAQALTAIAAYTGQPSDPSLAKRQPWVWSCEKCSDADCEHRLLSDLLARRQASAT